MYNLGDYTSAGQYRKANSVMTAAPPDSVPAPPWKNVPRLPLALATWFGCGLAPKAPGTVGTIGALPIGVLILWLGGVWGLLAATLVVFALGLWAAREFERHSGTHDSGAIVIDEVAGIWLALCFAGMNAVMIAAAFLLFRLFDIKKPGAIGWADRKLPGAWGVMMDDVFAGLYAGAVLGVVQIVIGFYGYQ